MTNLQRQDLPEPLSPAVKRTILAVVILLHAGGAWALARVEPARLVVGDVAPMEVRMVAPEGPAQPEVENAEPPPPIDLTPPPPELAAIVEPPPPDLLPPEFPVAKLDASGRAGTNRSAPPPGRLKVSVPTAPAAPGSSASVCMPLAAPPLGRMAGGMSAAP